MEASEAFYPHRDQSPDYKSGATDCSPVIPAAIIELHPSQTEEGVFNNETQPSYRNHVIGRKHIEKDWSKHGKTDLELLTLSDGRQHEVVTGVPKNLRSEYPVVFTTALGTSIRGHNWHTMYQMMDLGYPVVLVGPEGGHQNWPKTPRAIKRFVKNLVKISLEEAAENIHEILEVTDHSNVYKPGRIVSIGESQGAMKGLGVTARAHKFGRQVLYADHTAACFPMARKNLSEHISLLPETIAQTSLVGKISLDMSLERARHYPGTINLNPHFLLHVAAALPMLLSGEAGSLAREIDPDSQIHQTLFTGDSWSNVKGWQDIFADMPNTVIDARPGNHMTIVEKQTLAARVTRLRGLRDELEANNQNSDKINWRNVHMLGQAALSQAA